MIKVFEKFINSYPNYMKYEDMFGDKVIIIEIKDKSDVEHINLEGCYIAQETLRERIHTLLEHFIGDPIYLLLRKNYYIDSDSEKTIYEPEEIYFFDKNGYLEQYYTILTSRPTLFPRKGRCKHESDFIKKLKEFHKENNKELYNKIEKKKDEEKNNKVLKNKRLQDLVKSYKITLDDPIFINWLNKVTGYWLYNGHNGFCDMTERQEKRLLKNIKDYPTVKYVYKK